MWPKYAMPALSRMTREAMVAPFLFGSGLAGLWTGSQALAALAALLMGALLVFACLAAAMIATRRVDWYAINSA